MTDHITVQCPACGKQSKANSDVIGRQTKCACGEIFLIQPINKPLPTLKNGRVLKGTFGGKVLLEGLCPNCDELLKFKEEEIHLGKDTCPVCNRPFAVGEENIGLANTLRTEIESAKAQKETERKDREEGKKRLADEAYEVQLATKQAAIAEQAAQRRQEEEAAEHHITASLSELSQEVKADGIAETNDLFPNVSRMLALFKIVVGVVSVFLGMQSLGFLGLFFLLIGDPVESSNGGLALLGCIISVIILIVFYIFSMAGIELYKMLISIESQNRKANALLSIQIDLLEMAVRSKHT